MPAWRKKHSKCKLDCRAASPLLTAPLRIHDFTEMSNAAYAQLKEHAALIDELRYKFTEDDDPGTVAAVEQLLSEAAQASENADNDARQLIQSQSRKHFCPQILQYTPRLVPASSQQI